MSRFCKVALCWVVLGIVVVGFGLLLAKAFEQGIR